MARPFNYTVFGKSLFHKRASLTSIPSVFVELINAIPDGVVLFWKCRFDLTDRNRITTTNFRDTMIIVVFNKQRPPCKQLCSYAVAIPPLTGCCLEKSTDFIFRENI